MSRRENWWYYSQSRSGVYQGDAYFYSIDWDGREDVKRIDAGRCRGALLTGEYDYSCMPAMSGTVAAAIAGAQLTIMKGMGHFPMIENYPAFRTHLLAALEHVAGYWRCSVRRSARCARDGPGAVGRMDRRDHDCPPAAPDLLMLRRPLPEW